MWDSAAASRSVNVRTRSALDRDARFPASIRSAPGSGGGSGTVAALAGRISAIAAGTSTAIRNRTTQRCCVTTIVTSCGRGQRPNGRHGISPNAVSGMIGILATFVPFFSTVPPATTKYPRLCCHKTPRTRGHSRDRGGNGLPFATAAKTRATAREMALRKQVGRPGFATVISSRCWGRPRSATGAALRHAAQPRVPGAPRPAGRAGPPRRAHRRASDPRCR